MNRAARIAYKAGDSQVCAPHANKHIHTHTHTRARALLYVSPPLYVLPKHTHAHAHTNKQTNCIQVLCSREAWGLVRRTLPPAATHEVAAAAAAAGVQQQQQQQQPAAALQPRHMSASGA